MTPIAQSTSVTLSNGSNQSTATFSPAADVTVPSGSYFCWTIAVNTVGGAGIAVDTDGSAATTNLSSSQTIFIPELALPLAGVAALIPLLAGAARRRGPP